MFKSLTSFLAFLLLFTFFIPAFKALPKVPSEGFYLYVIPLIFLLEYPRKLFSDRLLLSTFSFLIVYLYYSAIGNYNLLDERVTEKHIDLFVSYASPCMLIVIYFYKFNLRNKVFLRKGVFLALFITCSSSIYAFIKNPNAARSMVGGNNEEEQLLAIAMNIGSYNFQYAFILILPVLYFLFRKEKVNKYLILIIGGIVSVIMAQIVAASVLLVLSFFVIFILYRIDNINWKNYLKLIMLLGLGLIFLKSIISQGISYMVDSGGTGLEMMDEKLLEIRNLLDGVEVTVETARNLEGYERRKQLSIEGFLKSPLTGGSNSGGHHYWIDGLAEHGLIGMFPIIFVLVIHFIWLIKKLNKEGTVVFLHTMFVFVFIGLFKNITAIMPLIYLFVVPALLLSHQIFLKPNQNIH